MNTKNADYRKINDKNNSSSKYHKKDCTNVRAKLKADAKKEIEKAKADAKKEIEKGGK